jgi:adenylate cyclase
MRSSARSRSQKDITEREAPNPESRRIAFRIGINIGDIIVEDGDILGDGVNVAARLEGLAEPGGICIARNVYDQVKAKIDHAFEPRGPAQGQEHRRADHRLSCPTGAGRRREERPAAVALLAAAAAAGWYAFWRSCAPSPAVAESGAAQAKPALALPDKPSIAVLPFSSLSDEPEQGHFADAITEDIITGLARFRELFVISSNSSFTYKGKAADIKQVGRELETPLPVVEAGPVDPAPRRQASATLPSRSANSRTVRRRCASFALASLAVTLRAARAIARLPFLHQEAFRGESRSRSSPPAPAYGARSPRRKNSIFT